MYTMDCGCEVEVETYIDYGCCEYCGTDVAIETVRFLSNCADHGG